MGTRIGLISAKIILLPAIPGFENYKEMNFQLKPSSDIFKLLPGFKSIPFHKIGIQRKK